MGLISNVLEKVREKNRRAGDIEDELRAQKRASEKMMSSDERELERFVEEQRQKDIKKTLDYFRKKKEAENRRNFTLDKKNIFHGQKALFNHERSIFLGR